MIGKQIANYRIDEKLGEGGMGVVYKAFDLDLDRPVAIKVLSDDLPNDPALLERFRTEAKTQAHLSHANIASLYNLLNIDGHTTIVMEYLEGETLDQILRRRGLVPWEEAIPWFKQALLGVGFAHRRGIIHRDIKPSNIMVNRYGVVKVMDFGIAKMIGGQRLTKTGMQVGTVGYMSPEQVRNLPVDVRTDIYSLGITLYELLTAHLPFESDSDFQVMSDHVNTPPPPPTHYYPYIPPGIQRCIMKALEKDPDARFQSVEEFGAALEHPQGTEALIVDNKAAEPPSPSAASATTVFATPAPSQATPIPPSPVRPGFPAAQQNQPVQADAPPSAPPSPSSKGKWILMAGVAGVLAVLAISVYGMAVFGHNLFRARPAPVSLTRSGGGQPDGGRADLLGQQHARDAAGSNLLSKPSDAATDQPTESAKPSPTTPNVLTSLASAMKTTSANGTGDSGLNSKPLSSKSPLAGKPRNVQPTPIQSTAPPNGGNVQQTASSPEPAQQTPPAAAASEAQFNEASEALVKLHARMDAANQSLATLKQQMTAQGLTLRGDIVAAESRMDSYFQVADRAFQSRDLESSQKNIDKAEQELVKIEHFLGR